MRRLAVMAHYDALGQVAPHVLRQVEALAGAVDRLIVVSTAGLDPAGDSAQALRARAELIQRPNVGYDFYSWKVALDCVGDLGGYDLVITCNDSCVGPLVPYEQILSTMHARPVDFWGITETARRGRHVQSYFVAYSRRVAVSSAFATFWRELTPIDDRAQVITRYELGLSRALLAAGFTLGSYFTETAADRRLARARHLWWAAATIRRLPAHRRPRALRRLPREPWNPVSALADRALDGARLPVVKLDTLRYDPYGLDAEHLLVACERAYPQIFDGVREYLERTRAGYPVRPGERAGARRPPAGLRRAIGYAR